MYRACVRGILYTGQHCIFCTISIHYSSTHTEPSGFLFFSFQLDVESVEDDHNEITEEESFIQNALNRLDQR